MAESVQDVGHGLDDQGLISVCCCFYTGLGSSGLLLTVWHQVVCICDMQSDAKIAEHHTRISVLLQPPFKFWFLVGHYGHLLLAPNV